MRRCWWKKVSDVLWLWTSWQISETTALFVFVLLILFWNPLLTWFGKGINLSRRLKKHFLMPYKKNARYFMLNASFSFFPKNAPEDSL